MSRPSGRRGRVVLYEWGHRLLAEPDVPGLRKRFAATEVRFGTGLRLAKRRVPLHVVPRESVLPGVRHLYDDGGGYPAGLKAEMEAYLRGRGHDVETVRLFELSELPGRMALSRSEGLDAAIRFMPSHDRALFRVTGPSFVPRLVEALVKGFPSAEFAVVGQGRLLDAVEGYLDGRVAFQHVDAGTALERTGRVVIGTHDGMHAGPVRLEGRHVLLFPDARQVLHRRVAHFFTRNDYRYRLLGILNDGVRVSRSEERRLRAWYGPDELTVLSKDAVARAVRTVWLDADRLPVLDEALGHADARHLGIRESAARNAAIAQWARSLADRGEVPPTFDAGAPPSVDGLPRIAVLAEGPTHACRLVGLLPGWRVDPLPGGPGRAGLLTRLPIAPDRVLASDAVPSGHAVLTTETLTRHRLEGLDVIVRADGSAGIPGCLSGRVIDNKTGRPLLIADVRDRHHPALKDAADRRRRAYHDRGWRLLGSEASP